jgi:uncharacterized membrane protein YdjX (TVP38/TMEM64 family)
MATKAEKTERRWQVIKGILFFLLSYAIAIVTMHVSGVAIEPLNTLTQFLYGTSVIGIVGNWFSAPTEDDK